MIDKTAFTSKIIDSLRGLYSQVTNINDPLKTEVGNQIKIIIEETISKMDLITREDIDVHLEVLYRTREKIDSLEEQVKMLEIQLAKTNKT